MKTLVIVRHSKSGWKDMNLSDYDRPLNKRGKKDAELMSFELTKKNMLIDFLLSSSSKRTILTSEYFMDKISIHEHEFFDGLYHAPSDLIYNSILKLKNEFKKVMIVGHNPGLTNIINLLTDLSLDNFPTSGIVIIEFNISFWNEVKPRLGKVKWMKFPKDFKL